MEGRRSGWKINTTEKTADLNSDMFTCKIFSTCNDNLKENKSVTWTFVVTNYEMGWKNKWIKHCSKISVSVWK